jgi:hypothetical protein
VAAPPVVWRVRSDAFASQLSPPEVTASAPLPPSDSLLARLAAATARGLDWFWLSSDVTTESLKVFAESRDAIEADEGRVLHAVLGAAVDDFATRDAAGVRARVAALGRGRCDAVMLEDATLLDLKSGRPFQRLAKLRDDGLAGLLFLGAGDVASAEWMVEHTPAHAVCVPYGLPDLSAAHALLDAAAELGTALLARAPERALWTPTEPPVSDEADVAFLAAEARVASAVLDLPTSTARIEGIARAAADPMPADVRARLWEAFRQQVPPPPKRRGGHAPEFGA